MLMPGFDDWRESSGVDSKWELWLEHNELDLLKLYMEQEDGPCGSDPEIIRESAKFKQFLEDQYNDGYGN